VLRLVKSLGGECGHVMIVGCEPADLGSDEEGKMGLSEPVMAAIDEAIALIDTLISKRLEGEPVVTVAHLL
jgi:hydrogenase maturation protease